jgi:hypothetical protein
VPLQATAMNNNRILSLGGQPYLSRFRAARMTLVDALSVFRSRYFWLIYHNSLPIKIVVGEASEIIVIIATALHESDLFRSIK